MDVEVHSEHTRDHAAITTVHNLAFGQEDEGRLVSAIRRSPGFQTELSLVAMLRERVVGHILFSPVALQSDDGHMAALALAPMAVLPEFQRRGIGSRLIRTGLTRCESLGHAIVVVVGHPQYYPRFGFVPARTLGLEARFEVPDQAFMARILIPPGLPPGFRGLVRYPPAFGIEEAR